MSAGLMQTPNTSTTFTIFGATGAQGGAVARAVARSCRFNQVRLVSRKPDGDAAKAILSECMKLAGGRCKFELMKGSFDDSASLDAALEGAQYTFAVTNWWELFFTNGAKPGEAGLAAGRKAGELELQEGKNWVDACKKANITFALFSGLEDPNLMGLKNVFHYSFKTAIVEYMFQHLPSASIALPFYIDNFFSFMRPQPDGTLAVPWGAGPFPMIYISDVGGIVDGLFKQIMEHGPSYWDKHWIGVASCKPTWEQIAAEWTKVAGKQIKYVNVTPEMFAKFGFAGDAEMAEMFQFQQNERMAPRSVKLAKALCTTKLTTLAEAFAANADKLKL